MIAGLSTSTELVKSVQYDCNCKRRFPWGGGLPYESDGDARRLA